jgi:hypothetical protein
MSMSETSAYVSPWANAQISDGVLFSKNGVTVEGRNGVFLVKDGIHSRRRFGSIHAALADANKRAALRRLEHNRFLKMKRRVRARKKTFK